MEYGTATDEASVIRPRRESDISEAAVALVKVHAADGYPVEGVSQPQAWLTPPGILRAWVAEIAGEVVGHVAVSRPNGEGAVSLWLSRSGDDTQDVAVLARLFVVPEARRRAVGEALMRAATAYARDQGIRLVLDVMTKDAAAIRLYTRLGWEQLGSAIHSFGEGQLAADAICFVSPSADRRTRSSAGRSIESVPGAGAAPPSWRPTVCRRLWAQRRRATRHPDEGAGQARVRRATGPPAARRTRWGPPRAALAGN